MTKFHSDSLEIWLKLELYRHAQLNEVCFADYKICNWLVVSGKTYFITYIYKYLFSAFRVLKPSNGRKIVYQIFTQYAKIFTIQIARQAQNLMWPNWWKGVFHTHLIHLTILSVTLVTAIYWLENWSAVSTTTT